MSASDAPAALASSAALCSPTILAMARTSLQSYADALVAEKASAIAAAKSFKRRARITLYRKQQRGFFFNLTAPNAG
jgi:hypothetical protein